ncbi:MAG: hypothetical protein Q8P21_00220, partial [bacterium]|nr:hypothetical protein [bacterium]
MNITTFTQPRQAKITDSRYGRSAHVLAGMGLPKQEFRVVGEVSDEEQVIVHPDDLSAPKRDPFTLRKDI